MTFAFPRSGETFGALLRPQLSHSDKSGTRIVGAAGQIRTNDPALAAASPRVDWVDVAKGLCIILVVMFHTVNHYAEATGSAGWMQAIVDFSKPFRMPDFFLISGLFLYRTINAPLAQFIDRKVIHFAYFYLLWLAITLVLTDHDVLRADPAAWGWLYLSNIIQPVGVLWFAHMLAVFYVATRLLHHAPQWAVLAGAAALQIAHQGGWIDTPSYIANRFMEYFVYFFAGYALYRLVFDFAEGVRGNRFASIGALGAWFVANLLMTSEGLAGLPVLGLVTGAVGALAVAATASLVTDTRLAAPLRYCGKHSIVIYLTFFFPMTILIRGLAPLDLIPDAGLACALIIAASVIGPLAFHAAIRRTPLIALYERPNIFRLRPGTPRLAERAA